jgi:hypothetical protein
MLFCDKGSYICSYFLQYTPELEILSLVFYILIVYIGSKHSHVSDSNLKNFVIIRDFINSTVRSSETFNVNGCGCKHARF